MLISVIVTTYNWPKALERVLLSLANQVDHNFEIIIADDGSEQGTANFIQVYTHQSEVNIKHVSQEDKGFRAAKIRNKAILQAKGEYIIFIDGDCMVLPNFISRHRTLMQPGYFVAGNRVLLAENYSSRVLNQQLIPYQLNLIHFLKLYFKKDINRIMPLLCLPLGFLRDLRPKRYKGVKTCNLAVYKQDLLKVNGFDESFEGWGFEDSDLVIRLIKLGIKCRSGKFGLPILHLWHKENDRSRQLKNLQKLKDTINKTTFIARQGLKEYEVN